ncbi:response regulator transcription factor [Krasilnikoviella flava]|uniref:response regulator transcription factor n=1 Tax=Krasilnikoviella flava TaxID=526729 RepID=UPI00111C881B|nr:LuxR C-terminal-related transcriptional regulator [Krasilnikoviella flava]
MVRGPCSSRATPAWARRCWWRRRSGQRRNLTRSSRSGRPVFRSTRSRSRTYAEIARALTIGEKTVSTHVSHLLAKTGARNRVELAGLARRHP